MRSIVILCFSFKILSAQSWVQLPDFPGTKRDDGVAIIVNNKAYFGTGLEEWNATTDFRSLDLATTTWSTIANMPSNAGRQYACVFSSANSFYVFGGDAGGPLNTLYKYDVLSNSWTQKASKPGAGLIAACSFEFGDKIIFAGGKTIGPTPNKEVWQYEISTDSWSKKQDFPFPAVWRASSASMNNYGYMLFGIDSNSSFRKNLYRYNPTADSWQLSSIFPLAQGRAYAAMHAMNGRLFVFGGMDSLAIFHGDTWQYAEGTNAWIPGPSIPGDPRRGGMSCATSKDFYYSCGLSNLSGRLTETWMTDVPVGINENEVSQHIEIYPNPVHDQLIIKTPIVSEAKTVHLKLMNLSGSVVLERATLDSALELETRNLQPGFYMLEVKWEGYSSLRKIIKD